MSERLTEVEFVERLVRKEDENIVRIHQKLKEAHWWQFRWKARLRFALDVAVRVRVQYRLHELDAKDRARQRGQLIVDAQACTISEDKREEQQ